MNPLTIGKSYLLRLPDQRILGRVRILKVEEDWAEGAFAEDDAFAEDRIESLRIQVVDEDEKVHPQLRVFIEGEEAFLGLPLKL